MAYDAVEYAADIRWNWEHGTIPAPVNDDQVFRDVVTDLFMDWEHCKYDVRDAYHDVHGYFAPSDVEALAWAVADICDVLANG